MSGVIRAGRGYSRPALVAVLAIAAVGVGVGAAVLRAGPNRGPIAVPNPEASVPIEYAAGSVRHIETGGAPELLVLDSIPPSDPARLLWFQGMPVHPTLGGTIALDGAGGLLRIDRNLRVRRIGMELEGREPAAVAPGPDYGYWVVGGTGEILRLDEFGRLLETLPGPFAYATIAGDESGSEVWLARSPEVWAYSWADASQPLFVRFTATEQGIAVDSVGSMRVPKQVLLGELANAGHIAIGDSAVYFAPFIRDEIVAYSKRGDTLWVARRGLPQSVAEPTVSVEDGEPTIDYAPVNLGTVLGPDDRLYVLSIPGFTPAVGRLDVFDPQSGRLLRTAELDTPLPTLAADGEGRVYVLDAFRLLTGVAPKERATFHRFDLTTMRGGRLRSEDVDGKVVLVNFWASWCAPCREEMPALDSLQQSIEDPDFAFITMNEDVTAPPAAAFIAEYGFDFPVLMGGGKLKADYHYIGLPFTVLLDRDGKEVQRWVGFAGPDQIRVIRSVIDAELERGREDGGMAQGH